MRITYRDSMGYIESKIDSYEVSFVDGYAFFDCVGISYRIPVSDIICISQIED